MKYITHKNNLSMLSLPTERYNSDSNVNNNGSKRIDLCRELDFKKLNGRFGDDYGVGDLTCHTSAGKSVVDYIITSASLFPLISDFKIDEFDSCLSDVHCPVNVTFRFQHTDCDTCSNNIVSDNPVYSNTNKQYVSIKTSWDCERALEYTTQFNDVNIVELQDKLNKVDINNLDLSELDSYVSEFCDICIEPANKLGLCKNNPKRTNRKCMPKKPNQPWFNKDCKQKRTNYIKIKNRLKVFKTEESRKQFKNEAKSYKKFINKERKLYYKNLHAKLRNLKFHKSKEYWDILNKASSSKEVTCNVPIQSFVEHFEKLSGRNPNKAESGSDFNTGFIFTDSVNEFINTPFTVPEITAIIKKLKNNKACGIDNIINEFLKHCPNSVVMVIVKLFNIVLESGLFLPLGVLEL